MLMGVKYSLVFLLLMVKMFGYVLVEVMDNYGDKIIGCWVGFRRMVLGGFTTL